MPITSVTKTIRAQTLSCGGSTDVTLTVTATPDITANPADIVMVLDRSGSMAGTPLKHLKAGAAEFVDIIARSTGSTDGSALLGGSRIGVVSFAATAHTDTPLVTDTATLNAAIAALTAGGNTNQADAFGHAGALFDTTAHRRVVVMFTDGEPTIGPDPTPVAEDLRADGVEIYCIGLTGSGGINESTLRAWASDPVDDHVIIAPTEAELEQAFADLAADIIKPGATNVKIEEEVAAAFQLTGITAPSIGDADITGARTLYWTIDKLAATAEETATLTFTVQHDGTTGGTLAVNEAITLTDDAGDAIDWPSPTVQVDCGAPKTDCCPDPIDFCISGCEDAAYCDLGDVVCSCQGRILTLSLTLKNVCPGRRIAVGVLLTELVGCKEHSRGLQTWIVPARTGTACSDVQLDCIHFVLPDDPDDCGCQQGMCRKRHLRARVFAHAADCSLLCGDDAARR